jgi:hypothetical protein
MRIVTSTTALTGFFLRPTLNRLLTCSMSSVGVSGLDDRRRHGCAHLLGRDRIGLRLFDGAGHIRFLDWLLVGHSLIPLHMERAAVLVRSAAPVTPGGHQKTVDPIWPTARGCRRGGLAAVLVSSRRAQISHPGRHWQASR